MPWRYVKNAWSQDRQRTAAGVYDVVDSGPPTNGVTGANVTDIGSTYTDNLTGLVYVNQGTKASPQWNIDNGAIPATSLSGQGVPLIAKATYSFAVDGGAQATIVPLNNVTIPNKAIILGGVVDVTTALVGATATIALGTTAGSSANSILAALAVASWGIGDTIAIKPQFTAATIFKMTAAGQINVTIAIANLTAGIFNVQLMYIIGG